MAINNIDEDDELNKKAEEVQKPEEAAAAVIKQSEEIIRTKETGITSIAYHQGKVFKTFKDKEKFIKLVNEYIRPIQYLR